MKKINIKVRLLGFILMGFLLFQFSFSNEPNILKQVVGEWKYASHIYRGVGRYGEKEVDKIKISVLNFSSDKIYFKDVTFIDTCFYTEFLPKAFFDRDYKSSHYLLDGPLAIKYSDEQLSKFIWLDFNCQPNGFGTFYLNGDTLVLKSTGGVTFFFTKIKAEPPK